MDIKARRWERVEYERLVETGFFDSGDPVELVGGHLIVAEPQGSNHFAAIRAVEEALRAAFGPGWDVQTQGPLALDAESEPEPDVCVVRGSFRDYAFVHPSHAPLVVEVSESSLAFDREHKGSLYARALVADYWIVNLIEHRVEVYRSPASDAAAPLGWRYRSAEVFGRDGIVMPLARPGVPVRVVDLLP